MAKQNWFLDIKETSASSCKMQEALLIEKIAPQSPAAELGLAPGDVFLSINGISALTANLPNILRRGKPVTYEFFRPKAKRYLKVKTDALPMGFRTEATSDGIVAQYKKGLSGWDASGVLTLWERGDYEHLRSVAKSMGKGGLLGKLLSKKSAHPITNLISAVCDIETGDKAKGYAELEEFRASHMRGFTSDVFAWVIFYQALKIEGTPGPEFTNKLWQVMDCYQGSDRMIALADKYEIDYDRKGQRQGHKFDYDETLRCLVGKQAQVDIRAMAQSLEIGQLLPICLMHTYRGNGPYNDAIKVYHSVYPHLKSKLAPMLVITDVQDKRPDRSHWYAAEERLVEAGIPITIAYDPNAGFVDRLLTGAPDFIVVDRDMNIVWDFELTCDYDYWCVAAGADKP